MSAFTIRDARWPEDREAAAGFIDGLQRFEHDFEPNRRVDPLAGIEYLDVLLDAATKKEGIVRIAEADGRAVGWTVAYPEADSLFVVPEERRFVYIAELYVAEGLRGTGIGRALIAVCEDWARANGFRILKIGAHADNTRAAETYKRAGYAPYALQLRKYIA